MRLVLIIVGALLLNSGCIQTPRERLKDTVCSLSCESALSRHGWQGARFSKIKPSKANAFIDRMFFDPELFTGEILESYNLSDMADKLSRGLARGFYAKSDDKEIFLYVELEESVFVFTNEGSEDPYYYFDSSYLVYDKIEVGMSYLGSGGIGEYELWEAGVDPALLHLTFPEEEVDYEN